MVYGRRRSTRSPRSSTASVAEEGVAAVVRCVKERWHMDDPPPGGERASKGCLVRWRVASLSGYGDSRWEAYAPS
jgi:hypothetical protein